MKDIRIQSWEDFEQKSQAVFARLDQGLANRPKIIASSRYHALSCGTIILGFLGTVFGVQGVLKSGLTQMDVLTRLAPFLDNPINPGLAVSLGVVAAAPLFVRQMKNVVENRGLVLKRGLFGVDFEKNEAALNQEFGLHDPTVASFEYWSIQPEFKKRLLECLSHPGGIHASSIRLIQQASVEHDLLVRGLNKLRGTNVKINDALEKEKQYRCASYGLSVEETLNMLSGQAKGLKEQQILQSSTMVISEQTPARQIRRL